MSLLNSILVKRPKRTAHNLSRSNKMTVKLGKLYPTMCEKVVPGDTFRIGHQAFVQFSPFAQQVYQEYKLRTEYFFIPTRILWKDFDKFLSGGEDGQTDYPHPRINYGELVRRTGSLIRKFDQAGTPELYQGFIGTLFDYLNLPYDEDWLTHFIHTENYEQWIPNMWVDALPFVSYFNVIYEYYRDENLQTMDLFQKLNQDGDVIGALRILPYVIFESFKEALDSGITDLTHVFSVIFDLLDSLTSPQILSASIDFMAFRNYPKDYFTGSLPFAQKGAVVNMPFSGEGEIETGLSKNSAATANVAITRSNPLSDYDEDFYNANFVASTAAGDTPIRQRVVFKNGLTSIDDLRTATRLQTFLEKNARGGTRYKELIYTHFGVLTKDRRIDRPEFLLGTSDPVILGNVYTTSQNADKTGLPGAATTTAAASSLSKHRKFFADEYGYIIGLVSIYPKAAYFKGIPRQFSELDRFDYYWPDFQNLGEQEVKCKELFVKSYTNDPTTRDERLDETFGYIPRYAHYKTRINEIHGDFRHNLRHMTAARDFDVPSSTGVVRLNSSFIQINPELNDLNRPFAYNQSAFDKITIDIYLDVKAIRPMDYYGTPRLI